MPVGVPPLARGFKFGSLHRGTPGPLRFKFGRSLHRGRDPGPRAP
jgi:hypothetical protein